MGLPPNDPLRFDKDGRRLTKEELDAKLEAIISSWDTWEWGVSATPPERRTSLSGERGAPRRRDWLSR